MESVCERERETKSIYVNKSTHKTTHANAQSNIYINFLPSHTFRSLVFLSNTGDGVAFSHHSTPFLSFPERSLVSPMKPFGSSFVDSLYRQLQIVEF